MVRKVLERELPGWQDGLDAEEDIVAVATAKELMGPEEAEQYGELLKGLGVAWSIQGDLMRVARERKGGPL
jgi:hypothetical protein